jgi:hypothetical protein
MLIAKREIHNILALHLYFSHQSSPNLSCFFYRKTHGIPKFSITYIHKVRRGGDQAQLSSTLEEAKTKRGGGGGSGSNTLKSTNEGDRNTMMFYTKSYDG